ncbi:MAG: hypothetical protein Q4D12_07655, partial [Bacteroidales bacterium]|nr:hypothetical protein [Bacteroidales bacterium]
IGRRAGLKHQWGNPSRFDPGSGYKAENQVIDSQPFIFLRDGICTHLVPFKHKKNIFSNNLDFSELIHKSYRSNHSSSSQKIYFLKTVYTILGVKNVFLLVKQIIATSSIKRFKQH